MADSLQGKWLLDKTPLIEFAHGLLAAASGASSEWRDTFSFCGALFLPIVAG